MAENNNSETNDGKRVPLSIKVDPAVFGIVSGYAVEEDRSLSNMIERLLKTHPRIQPSIEAEAAEAAAVSG